MFHVEEFRCPYLTRDGIIQKADNFYIEYWGERSLPVDMELIVEKTGLDIIPFPNLHKIEAYLKIEAKGIIVNLETYMDPRYERRLRFSFAHEIGHYVLHRDIIDKMRFDDVEEYISFITTCPEKEYRKFEYQANEFAGRLLVPHSRLLEEINYIKTTMIKDDLVELTIKDPEQLLAIISPTLCKPFGVSEEVIEKRVEREYLWPFKEKSPE